jgi:hypothetical protein
VPKLGRKRLFVAVVADVAVVAVVPYVADVSQVGPVNDPELCGNAR